MLMAVNKVIFGNQVLVDLTGDTVAAGGLMSGMTAHDRSGATIAGTVASKTAKDMFLDDTGVNLPAGLYAGAIRFELNPNYPWDTFNFETDVLTTDMIQIMQSNVKKESKQSE